MIRKPSGITWNTHASTLRTSALSLIHSIAEYCLWLNSWHVKMIDTKIYETMRINSGCLKNTPLHWLPMLLMMLFKISIHVSHTLSK